MYLKKHTHQQVPIRTSTLMNQTPEHISSIYSSPWTTGWFEPPKCKKLPVLCGHSFRNGGWYGYISKMSVTGMMPNPYDEPIGANHNKL